MTLGRWWAHLGARFGRPHGSADPTPQIKQALAAAQAQHRMLREHAGHALANQKLLELERGRTEAELERETERARLELVMQAHAQRAGDAPQAARHEAEAEAIALRIVALEQSIGDVTVRLERATSLADQARRAVQQSADALRAKLDLLSQLDQARLQEQINAALAGPAGRDPGSEELRAAVEARQAEAAAVAELRGDSVEGRVRELQEAARRDAAHRRLDEMRGELESGGGG